MAQSYQRLDEGCFRLLSFDDDTGESCSLDSYSINDAPFYIALSYTWGPASYQKGRPSSQIYSSTINGNEFQIQQNLHDAFSHLAKHVRSRRCLFWVDAICINQRDFEERNSQVKKMKDIYQNAKYIFAWLGIPFDEEEMKLAVKMMHDMNQYLKDGLADNGDRIAGVLPTITSHNPAFPVGETSETWKAWEGLKEMFEQSYWHRTWIYQEATTPGEIWFFCGDHSFDDIYLSAAVAFGLAFSHIPDFPRPFRLAAGPASNVAALVSARIQREKDRKRGLIELMTEMRLTHCTDERDKVYAPLGHTADSATLYINVDYTKSLTEVYIDVVRVALSTPNHRMDFLAHVFIPAEDASNDLLQKRIAPALPSWVPDWRQTVIILSFDKDPDQTKDKVPLYQPCRNTTPQIEVVGLELRLTGTVFENLSVVTLMPIWDDPEASMKRPRDWHSSLLVSEEESRSSDLDVVIRRSLVADRSIEESGTEDNAFISKWKRGGMADWNIIDSATEDQSLYHMRDSMIDNITAVCYGRRMARLKGGDIAILPAAAKIGDQVALFYGGRCLYLVRPTKISGIYNFIGECYVDGLMDGKLMDDHSTRSRLLRLV